MPSRDKAGFTGRNRSARRRRDEPRGGRATGSAPGHSTPGSPHCPLQRARSAATFNPSPSHGDKPQLVHEKTQLCGHTPGERRPPGGRRAAEKQPSTQSHVAQHGVREPLVTPVTAFVPKEKPFLSLVLLSGTPTSKPQRSVGRAREQPVGRPPREHSCAFHRAACLLPEGTREAPL